MKKILFFCIVLPLSQLHAQSLVNHSRPLQVNGFIQNKGQVCDQSGHVNSHVSYLYSQDNFHLLLTPSGFSYELIQETPDSKSFPESGFMDEDDQQAWQDAQPLQTS